MNKPGAPKGTAPHIVNEIGLIVPISFGCRWHSLIFVSWSKDSLNERPGDAFQSCFSINWRQDGITLPINLILQRKSSVGKVTRGRHGEKFSE